MTQLTCRRAVMSINGNEYDVEDVSITFTASSGTQGGIPLPRGEAPKTPVGPFEVRQVQKFGLVRGGF